VSAFPTEAPGSHFRREIGEQPEALRRLLSSRDEISAAARALSRRSPELIRVVAHGSSDNAASYGMYAFGMLAGRTVFRDSISLVTYYGVDIDLERSAVVALSQSGRTLDVVDYVERARAKGALTIAVTNEPAAELGQAAEIVVPLAAGDELAVAATKTYTNQLAALALLAAMAGGREREVTDGLQRTAELQAEALDHIEQAVMLVAAPFAFVGRMYVTGRGIEFATAREIALKLTETCRIAAEPLTATDLVHGPVAALDPLFPVWVVAARDNALPAVVEASARARAAGATLVASGDAAAEIPGASFALPVPSAPLPILGPLLSILPGQLFAAAVARTKGLDSDKPVGLEKVTLVA
jgi:glucosamine--fructose-6-phosphate aminotransferase (isomerizing)